VDIGQWVSNPGQCDADWKTSGTGNLDSTGRQNASLTLDWSQNYGTQLVTEVRFRYGTMAANAWGVQLVIFSIAPLNTSPVAVPIHDGSGWYAFTFEVPVTASGIQLVWYGLQSRNGGQSCFVSIANVEAWTGTTPDPIPVSSPTSSSLSPSALAAVIVVPLALVLLCALGAVWVLQNRRKNLTLRFSNHVSDFGTAHEIVLRRRMQKGEVRAERLIEAQEEVVVGGCEEMGG
ncbi:hypothetical protein HDU98_006145, partial [Podochytrium sp. JEL0797]